MLPSRRVCRVHYAPTVTLRIIRRETSARRRASAPGKCGRIIPICYMQAKGSVVAREWGTSQDVARGRRYVNPPTGRGSYTGAGQPVPRSARLASIHAQPGQEAPRQEPPPIDIRIEAPRTETSRPHPRRRTSAPTGTAGPTGRAPADRGRQAANGRPASVGRDGHAGRGAAGTRPAKPRRAADAALRIAGAVVAIVLAIASAIAASSAGSSADGGTTPSSPAPGTGGTGAGRAIPCARAMARAGACTAMGCNPRCAPPWCSGPPRLEPSCSPCSQASSSWTASAWGPRRKRRCSTCPSKPPDRFPSPPRARNGTQAAYRTCTRPIRRGRPSPTRAEPSPATAAAPPASP